MPAFDHERLAAALAKATGQPVEPDRLPIEQLDFHDAEPIVRFSTRDRSWECDLRTYELRERKDALPPASSLPAGETLRPSVRTGDETTLTDLSHRTRLNISTCHHLLSTLVNPPDSTVTL